MRSAALEVVASSGQKGLHVDLPTKLRRYVMSEQAEGLLSRYLVRQSFSGCWFDTIGGRGDADPVANRFTSGDIVAVSTLSVNISGWAAIDLLDRWADDLGVLLADVPLGVDLHEASDAVLDAVYAVQDALDDVTGIGHVTRSKLLARKRPKLVPIRDQHVLIALTGKDHGSFTAPLRDALQADDVVRDRLLELGSSVGREDLSMLRILDIVVWMQAHGAASSP